MRPGSGYAGGVRRFILLAWALSAGLAPVTADTTLLTSINWVVEGTTDPLTNATFMNVTVGKGAPAQFSELKFSYKFNSATLVPVFSITSRGAFRPSLAPPNEAGGAFQFGSYQDCELGLVGPLAVTEIGLPAKLKKNGMLQLTGVLDNGTSLRTSKFTLKFATPRADFVRVDVRGRFVATRDFCVDQTAVAAQDKFRLVTMAADYLSAADNDNDLLRFVRTTERTCLSFYGCYVRHQSDCVALTNQVPGYLIDIPRILGNPWLMLAHTTSFPRITPCLQVAVRSPSGIRPQGWLEAPVVELWDNWLRVRKSYKARQSVVGLSCSLEATPPRPISCDWVQP